MISRFRPTCPILAMTPFARTARQLAMAWGIRPHVMALHGTPDEIVWHAVEEASALGVVRPGDLVGVLVGSPSDVEPTTDVLRLVRIS
jgi:pyruvate kinase